MFVELDEPRLAENARLDVTLQLLQRRAEAEGEADCCDRGELVLQARERARRHGVVRQRLLAKDSEVALERGGRRRRVDVVRRDDRENVRLRLVEELFQ